MAHRHLLALGNTPGRIRSAERHRVEKRRLGDRSGPACEPLPDPGARRAKIDNFCFSRDGRRVAAVDFQYVGGGPGIKDVAYFIDSCLDGDACERQESHWLDLYFQALRQALQRKQKAVDADAVEQDWRALYPLAWTDFHRFLKGWSPARWDPDSYSERLARQVIEQLQNTARRDDAFVEK
jgi:hypothetical protein